MQLKTALAESDDDPLREVVGANVRRVTRLSLFKRAALKTHMEFILTGRSRAWLREFFDCLPGEWVIREHAATKELARKGTADAIYLVERKEGSARGTELYRSLTRAIKLGERLRVELEILKDFAPALLAVSGMIGEMTEAERIDAELDAELDIDVGPNHTDADARAVDTAFADLVARAETADDITSVHEADNDPYGDTNGEEF